MHTCTVFTKVTYTKPSSKGVFETNISDFWDVLLNISGPGAYFSKQFFGLKPWVVLGTMNLII